MQRLNAILKSLALGTVPVVGLFACILLFQVSAAVETLKTQGVGTLSGANQALATVNAPCKDTGHQVECGTLAGVNQAVKNTGILAAQGAEQIKQSGQLIAATTRNLNAVGISVTGTMASLQGTATQTTTSLATLTASASGTMDAATTTIKATQPLVGRATLFVEDADDAVKTLPPITANVQEITAQAAIITKDAKVEEQKYVYPPKTPWYKKIAPTLLKGGELAYDFIR